MDDLLVVPPMEKSSELSGDDLEVTNTSMVEESGLSLRRRKPIAEVGDIDVTVIDCWCRMAYQ